MERTLVLVKPDAIQRGLIGEVISRLEKKGLKTIGMKMMQLSSEMAKEHYAHLSDKEFFEELNKYVLSSPVVVICLEGVDSVEVVRSLCGITNARAAATGTIRGDLAMSVQCNLVHAADSRDRAQREIDLFFKPDELFDYQRSGLQYLYSTYELKT
ncbi:MAG: Nucleoside diphosphate kinase [Firmicutes bacterium]|nr:Nucleoside diphosphate kinase [Bacillota bacterium]